MFELDEGDLMYMFIIYLGILVGKVREFLQQMDKFIVILFEVEMVFGKIGCVDMVIDFVLLMMIEIFIQFKLKVQWRVGMIIEKFKEEFNVLV